MSLLTSVSQLDELANGSYNEPSLVHGLLCELSLYFLQYTEGANLRHTPEALWFLFWCANTSAEMEALWGAGACGVRLARTLHVRTLACTASGSALPHQ